MFYLHITTRPTLDPMKAAGNRDNPEGVSILYYLITDIPSQIYTNNQRGMTIPVVGWMKAEQLITIPMLESSFVAK